MLLLIHVWLLGTVILLENVRFHIEETGRGLNHNGNEVNLSLLFLHHTDSDF